MTARSRVVEPPPPRPGRVLAWRRDAHERDRALFAGARRQRELRQQQAARRNDDDPEDAA
jgi:hypothetical protein